MWNILKCLAYVISVTFKTFDVIKERGYNSEEMMNFFQTVNKKLTHINLNDSTAVHYCRIFDSLCTWLSFYVKGHLYAVMCCIGMKF